MNYIKLGFIKKAKEAGLDEKQALGIWDRAPHNAATKNTLPKVLPKANLPVINTKEV